MSVLRRMEILFGGPARPIEVTVKEADLIADALADWAQSYRAEDIPQEGVEDAQADSEALALAHDLRQRFLEHAGYERRPRRF